MFPQVMLVEQSRFDTGAVWVELNREGSHPRHFLQHGTDEHSLTNILPPGEGAMAGDEYRLYASVVFLPKGIDDQGARFVFVILRN